MPNALISRDRLFETHRSDASLAALVEKFLGCSAPLPDPVLCQALTAAPAASTPSRSVPSLSIRSQRMNPRRVRLALPRATSSRSSCSPAA